MDDSDLSLEDDGLCWIRAINLCAFALTIMLLVWVLFYLRRRRNAYLNQQRLQLSDPERHASTVQPNSVGKSAFVAHNLLHQC